MTTRSADITGYTNTNYKNFGIGAAAAAPLSLGMKFILDSKYHFRTASPFAKFTTLSAPIAIGGVLYMSTHSTRRVEGAKDKHNVTLDGEGERKEPTLEGDWSKIVLGTYIGALSAAFYAINKSPLVSRADKVKQLRVYGAGAGILVLCGALLGGFQKSAHDVKSHVRVTQHGH